MKNNYIKLIILLFLLSGCGAKIVNLGFNNLDNSVTHPILIYLTNNSQQTVFTKIVKFDGQDIAAGKGELFKIPKGIHSLDVKISVILNGENIYSYLNYLIVGELPPNSFLTSTKVYHIKANFKDGYTYMVDQGQLYSKDKGIPSKLCLLKRPSLENEVKAYTSGTIFNHMQLVACYNYEGDTHKDYRISNIPW